MSPISFTQNSSTSLHLAPILSPSLIQSLSILQMPILELSAWIEKQLEENPLIEVIPESFSTSSFRVIEYQPLVEQRDFYKETSLYEYIERQARLFFKDPEDLHRALTLLAELDEKGFLPFETPYDDIVKAMQHFDPPGICARSLRESLLLQLGARDRSESLAFSLLENHFEDLLYHRIAKICKTLRCTREECYQALYDEIGSLSMNPANRFSLSETIFPTPDLFLREEEGAWQLEINQTHLPRLRLSSRLLSQVKESDTMRYLQKCHKDAKQLLIAVRKRNSTLQLIGRLLLTSQRSFLEGVTTKPQYLSVRETAEALQLHPATIARTIANKYISCAHLGIVPLKFFFRSNQSKENRDIGEAIIEAISKENHLNPFCDEEIAKKLGASGITCARRTVAKYRKLRQIPAASIRKNKSRQ